MKNLRKSAIAGLFYPDNPSTLKNTLISFLSQATRTSQIPPKFLIVPHAGYMYSGKIAGEGFAEVSEVIYKKIMILGPSHRHYFQGIAESADDGWQTPLGTIEINHLNDPRIQQNSEYHRDEHCLEIQVPFIQLLFPESVVSPLLLSGPISQAHSLAEKLADFDDEDTLWVISSDFSHVGPGFQYDPTRYGFKSGEEIDLQAVEKITQNDPEAFMSFIKSFNATICGALPITVAIYMGRNLNRSHFTFKKYDCSGNQTKDVNSVGYATLYC